MFERHRGRFSGKRHGHKEEHYARHIMPLRNRPIEGIAPIDARSSDRGGGIAARDLLKARNGRAG